MPPILEDVIDVVHDWNSRQRIADIRIGLGYTAVKLESGHAGVAGLLRHRLGRGSCSLLPQAGTLAGMLAADAIGLLRSASVVETSVGLAALNALIAWHAATFPEASAWRDAQSSNQELLDLLHLRADDRVGMVGNIAPVASAIRQRVRTCDVFDEGKAGQEGITDTARLPEILPRCDVVLLSATSLLNHTFDDVAAQAANAREMCVIGPSTPLLPEVFRPRGVTLLAGCRILDVEQVLRIVSEAGGTRRFGKLTQKINQII